MWSNQNLYIANGSVKSYNHLLGLLGSFLKSEHLSSDSAILLLFILEKGEDRSTKIFVRNIQSRHAWVAQVS